MPFGALSQVVDELDELMATAEPTTEYVNNAFKSTRVINGHSMEMLGEGVLDSRILHRFGMVKNGFKDIFGLDIATMRIGFDYGISKNLTIGIGRSTFLKEFDGFVKYRIAHQQTGKKNIPVSVIVVPGITIQTLPFSNSVLNDFENKLGYYGQVIIGRKFSRSITVQLSPTFVHKNLVPLAIDKNDFFSIGIGARAKVSNRVAIVAEAFPNLYGARTGYNFLPLALGIDIETGGHVFQLHISNSRGMNEKAVITETLQDWGKGEIQMGFNLSRVFTVKKNTSTSF